MAVKTLKAYYSTDQTRQTPHDTVAFFYIAADNWNQQQQNPSKLEQLQSAILQGMDSSKQVDL